MRLALFIISIAFTANALGVESRNLSYPKTPKKEHTINIHNEVITDYYYWLRDGNWPNSIKNQEVLDYLALENKYTDDYFSKYQKQEQQLIEEIKAQDVKEDRSSYPVKDGNYYYYRKYTAEGDRFILCRKKGDLESQEKVILDVNKLARQFPKIIIGSFFNSPDHNIFAYATDLIGQERYNISVKNLLSGVEDRDVVHDTRGRIVWSRNSKGFFYVKVDSQLRATKVYYHELGSKEQEDKLIYQEKDKNFLVNISGTSDDKYLVIDSYNNSENEIRVINIEGRLLSETELILPKKEGQLYFIDHAHDSFYLKINDKGPEFRLVKLQCTDMNNESCITEIIPYQSNQQLKGFSFSKDYLVANLKSGMNNEVVVFNKQGISKRIKFNEEVYSAYGKFPTYESDFIRIDYESFLSPPSVLEYDYEQGKVFTRYVKKTSSKYDKSRYKSERIFIKADDGVEVPVSLFYRKDKFKKDGTNPVFLYGYGSYGISKTPHFNPDILPLVDRGFVYAMAHVRGGGELGEKWYQDAKLLTKKRTFNDYINCAEALIKRKYIDAKK